MKEKLKFNKTIKIREIIKKYYFFEFICNYHILKIFVKYSLQAEANKCNFFLRFAIRDIRCN